MILLLLLWPACADQDPCPQMCSDATGVYGGCLSSWGADWQDAGFLDARAYFHSCETWVWEMRLLEREARARGKVDQLGHVDAFCVDISEQLTHSGATCDDWTAIDWETQPW